MKTNVYISKSRLKDYIETWNGSHKLLASSPLPRPTAGPAGHLWTCGPHPGDNLLMEIEPKYIYKVPLNISLAGGETTRET